MPRFTKNQKIDILEAYLACEKKPKETQSRLRVLWGNFRATIARGTLANLYRTWRETGSVEAPRVCIRPARSEENY